MVTFVGERVGGHVYLVSREGCDDGRLFGCFVGCLVGCPVGC